MNNVVETFAVKAKSVARVVARRRWLVLGVAAATGLACGIGIAGFSDRYKATATVYVDTDTVLKPLMSGLTYQPDIDQQVRMLARTLISRPNVERLVSIPELGFQVKSPSEREDVVSGLMGQIMVVPTTSGNLFEITYRGSTAELSKRVVDATVDMFVNSGVGAKRRDSRDAGEFVEDQIQSYEAKLVEAENRIKDFKARNFGVSGMSSQDYFARVSALTEDVSKLRMELRAAEQSRETYRRELAAEDSRDDAQLEAQKKRLVELLGSYTEAHPEVISTRRAIESLQAETQKRRRADASALSTTGQANATAVYQSLRISLADTEAKVSSLRSQLAAQQGRLDAVRALADRAPQVEAELAQMNRDYDTVRKNYDLMVARREAASLGVKLDETSHLATFRVIEPARVSKSPVFPSRLHLALIAVFVALAAGIVAAVVADLLWPTFDEPSALMQFSKRPVLGTVSVLETAQDKRIQRMRTLSFSGAFAVLVMMQAMWMAWIASH